jgi:hypothetical protein
VQQLADHAAAQRQRRQRAVDQEGHVVGDDLRHRAGAAAGPGRQDAHLRLPRAALAREVEEAGCRLRQAFGGDGGELGGRHGGVHAAEKLGRGLGQGGGEALQRGFGGAHHLRPDAVHAPWSVCHAEPPPLRGTLQGSGGGPQARRGDT